MAQSQLKTKIILRNDEMTAWEASNPTLSKGEVALAKREDGSYDLRIGNDISEWKDLSGSFAISSDQVIGLDKELEKIHVPQVYTELSVDTTKGLDVIISESTALSAQTFGPGDMLVLKDAKGVASAYQYDKEEGWIACDGNVDASKVILNSNITMAGNYGSLGNFSHTANTVATISANGWSVKEFFDKMFTGEELLPSKSSQGVSISMTNATVEYGKSHAPVFTVSLTPGSYTYGSNTNTSNGSTTGIKAEECSMKYKIGETIYELTGDWDSSQFTNTNAKTKSLTGDAINNLTSTIEFNSSNKLSATASWSAAADGTYNPLTNLKIEVKPDKLAEYRASSGSKTTDSGSSKYTITVNKPRFYMFTNASTVNPTSINTNDTNITTSNTINKWCKSTDGSLKTSFTSPSNAAYYELFYAIPANIKSSWTGVDGTGVNSLPVETKQSITVTLANGTTDTYDLFIVRNAGAYGNPTCSMTFA